LLNADKPDSGYIAPDQYSGGKQHKIEQSHGGPPPLNGLAGAVDGDDSDTDKDDPGDEPTNNNHCQFSASDRFRRVHFTPIVETEPDAEPGSPIRQNG
jgi:hypothetical protein